MDRQAQARMEEGPPLRGVETPLVRGAGEVLVQSRAKGTDWRRLSSSQRCPCPWMKVGTRDLGTEGDTGLLSEPVCRVQLHWGSVGDQQAAV